MSLTMTKPRSFFFACLFFDNVESSLSLCALHLTFFLYLCFLFLFEASLIWVHFPNLSSQFCIYFLLLSFILFLFLSLIINVSNVISSLPIIVSKALTTLTILPVTKVVQVIHLIRCSSKEIKDHINDIIFILSILTSYDIRYYFTR